MSQTSGGRKGLETIITALSVLGAIYLIFEHIAKFLWSLQAESFFGVARYHFYDNLLASKIFILVYVILWLFVIVFPFTVNCFNNNWKDIIKNALLGISFFIGLLTFYFLLLFTLSFISWFTNSWILWIWLMISIGFAVTSYKIMKAALGTTSSTYISTPSNHQLSIFEKIGFVIFCIFFIFLVLFSWKNITKTPISEQKYEIAYHDNKTYLIVPQTATDSLFIEATVIKDKTDTILAFEKGVYQIKDKSTVERIEYLDFNKVLDQLNKDNRYQLTKENNQLWLTFPLGEEEIKKKVVNTNGIKQTKFNNLRHQILPSISGDSYILIFDDKELKQVVYSDNLSIPEQSETSSKLSQTSTVKSSSAK